MKKNVVILGSSNINLDKTIEWIYNFGHNAIIIDVDSTNVLNIKNLSINKSNNLTLRINNSFLNSNKIFSIWYRDKNLDLPIIENAELKDWNKDIRISILSQLKTLNEFIIDEIDNTAKKKLGNYYLKDTNKLITLKKALINNLNIAKTIVTQNKNTLLKFSRTNKLIINKSIQEIFTTIYRNEFYKSYTTIVKNETLIDLGNIFFPSLFQKLIQKKFEIRSVFLNGRFYSSAIFSQSSEKTKIDFRNYDNTNPNRIVPYKLPNEIENKLKHLFYDLNLNYGSIDIIYSEDDRYYFLEINPNGQIGMVSYPCFYNIEKEIAKFLTHE